MKFGTRLFGDKFNDSLQLCAFYFTFGILWPVICTYCNYRISITLQMLYIGTYVNTYNGYLYMVRTGL